MAASKKTIKQQLAESSAMLKARDKASQTPAEVREAFLNRARNVGPVRLLPFSLGLLWLMEELKHPFAETAKPVKAGEPPEQMSMKDIARAIFAFTDPEGAAEALSQGEACYDSEAMSIATGIPVGYIPAINAAMQEIFREGLATIPGAGNANPPRTGS